MRRKVIQIADSTQLISLPRKWAIRNGLKKGDELDVVEEGTNIVISANDTSQKVEKISVDAEQYGFFTLRSIAAIYKAGYDEVEIHFQSPENLQKLPNFLNEHLPGYEVFDHSEHRYLIKTISKETPEEFDPTLRRIFLLAVSMGRNLIESLKNTKHDVHKLNNINAMEVTMNRLCNYCQRLINKRGYKEYKKTAFIYTIIWAIEKYCDEIKYVGQYCLDNPNAKFTQKSVELIERAINLFETYYTEFYKFNETTIGKIAEERKEIIKNAFPLLEKGKDAVIAHHAIILTQMTFNLQGLYLGLQL